MRPLCRTLGGGWAVAAVALLLGASAAEAQILYCGDGIVSAQLNEQCDDGNQVSGDGCSSTCYIENCGDGVVGPDEQCDDGNDVDYDGCTNCTIDHTPGDDDPVCGDGALDYAAGEHCDDGNTIGCDGCGPTCKFQYCGNGVVDPCQGGFEQCDDGNFIPGDGCSPTCTLEDPDPRCGNGVVDYGELCDDGNLASGDGCSATCIYEYCGNGVVEAGEECDDGAGPFYQGDHGCNAQCEWDNTCGDGVVEPGEECDAGAQNVCNFGCCNESCRCPSCGDGVVQQLACPDCPNHSSEQCDDGNAADGDGCSSSCQIERCGNGVIEAGEQCDDGNIVAGDGCDASCAAEGEPNCCSADGGKPSYMEVRFTHPLVANASSITIDHGRKCGDFDDREKRCGGDDGHGGGGGGRHGKKWESFKSKFVSDTETWTGMTPVDENAPTKVENSDLAITAVAGQTVTFRISGANKLNSNSSFLVTIGSDEFAGCIHTSCSQPLYVGQVFGTYFEVTALSGSNVDPDNPFCQ